MRWNSSTLNPHENSKDLSRGKWQPPTHYTLSTRHLKINNGLNLHKCGNPSANHNQCPELNSRTMKYNCHIQMMNHMTDQIVCYSGMTLPLLNSSNKHCFWRSIIHYWGTQHRVLMMTNNLSYHQNNGKLQGRDSKNNQVYYCLCNLTHYTCNLYYECTHCQCKQKHSRNIDC